jgi:hypothetical protein
MLQILEFFLQSLEPVFAKTFPFIIYRHLKIKKDTKNYRFGKISDHGQMAKGTSYIQPFRANRGKSVAIKPIVGPLQTKHSLRYFSYSVY